MAPKYHGGAVHGGMVAEYSKNAKRRVMLWVACGALLSLHIMVSTYWIPILFREWHVDGAGARPYDRKALHLSQTQEHHGVMSQVLTETSRHIFGRPNGRDSNTDTFINHWSVQKGGLVDENGQNEGQDDDQNEERLLKVRSFLSNPLNGPPKYHAEDGSWDVTLVEHVAPPLTKMYVEECSDILDPTYVDSRGKEWVMSSCMWSKKFGNEVNRYRWCRGGRMAEVPVLEQVMVLKSERDVPSRAVTIVTQLSIERLYMLEQQCAHWPHPISAVVYVPLVEGRISSTEDEKWQGASLFHGIKEVNASYQRMKTSTCILDVEVVAEERCTAERATLYPTNAVRNRALMQSRSDSVLLLDVDFVVDQSLAYDLENEEKYLELKKMLSSGMAVILPAFEAWDQGTRGRDIALTAVQKGKSYIARKFMFNVVMGFHMAHYPQGHEPTLFWKWINTTESYPVEHEMGFEPYILMSKRFVPYYDERFRGYYFNKVEHLMHISKQLELQFVVHPMSFVVHVPHPKAKTKWKTKRTGQKERNHALFLDSLEEMKLKSFVPVTAFPHLCLPAAAQIETASAISAGKQSYGAEEQIAMLRAMAQEVAAPQPQNLTNGQKLNTQAQNIPEFMR